MATLVATYGKQSKLRETTGIMEKDYNPYVSKYSVNNPPPPPPNPPSRPTKYQSNLGVLPMEPVMEQVPMGIPPRPPSSTSPTKQDPEGANAGEELDGDEALLDLAQLEELHHEAERMKALGNKHMAAQEYTRAYNAYSAALQLSPVGPSSHVFLSNRSAALLSLKRYSAAATDARRAIALAPTFGKAHARLGQALYFLKDYEGAVMAYQEAIHYEPDNAITKTYLDKAKVKWERQKDKQARTQRGEEISVLTENSSVQATVINSIATDPNKQGAVVQTMGFRGPSSAMAKAIGRPMRSMDDTVNTINTNDDDPDFEEALRIQERANRFLANKNYKYAIEEYTAALFLIPDDYNLSPDLHLGRAHALNGSRRHESAKIDANLAIKLKPSPEAYSTLAKSLFYMKDFQGAIDAFGNCKNMLPEGESLSMFDRAYLQKCEAALQGELESDVSPSPNKSTSTAPIPKLKPPRFVPREEALNRTPNIPAMPKSWPQQSPRDQVVHQYGPEREVLFLSEALGIKLNRGPDGVVRVIDVSPQVEGSPIARQGEINVGDVIREAAGVDLRRPITNIMWGDTVALIKMAPRPIVLVVAAELNPPPPAIVEQRKAAAANALSPTSSAEYFPSNSSGDERVADLVQPSTSTNPVNDEQVHELVEQIQSDAAPTPSSPELEEIARGAAGGRTSPEASTVEEEEEDTNEGQSNVETQDTEGDAVDQTLIESTDAIDSHTQPQSSLSTRDEETSALGAEVFFLRTPETNYGGWDNLRWMSYSGTRKISFKESVYRFLPGRRSLFWSGDQYLDRILVIYEEPQIILVLRKVESLAELLMILDLPEGSTVEEPEKTMKSYLIVESVVDPNTCKLKFSPLTMITSVVSGVANDDFRRRSCFELTTPFETLVLSAVRLRQGAERALTSFTDSGAFLETSTVEHSLVKSISDAHRQNDASFNTLDCSWKHQIFLGTLHSYVSQGKQSLLDEAIQSALRVSKDNSQAGFLDSRIVDQLDEGGRTALHYACIQRFSSAVVSLVKVGANVDLRVQPNNMTPYHLCALNLDSKSIEAILSTNRRPNVIDQLGQTPAYLAIKEGCSIGGLPNASELFKFLRVLDSAGGEVEAPMGFRNPISLLASQWRAEELGVVLKLKKCRYPLMVPNASDNRHIGISVSALQQYPLHSCFVVLRKKLKAMSMEENPVSEASELVTMENKFLETIRELLGWGFEPNERLEGLIEQFDGSDDLAAHIGFAPIQILAAASIDIVNQKSKFNGTIFMGLIKLVRSAAELLVRNGGRLSLESPPIVRPRDGYDQSSNSLEDQDLFLPTDRTSIKIHSNKEIIQLLGGSDLAAAEEKWKSKAVVESLGSCVFHVDKLAIENSAAPGGSDTKSCYICWKPFGTITNRKHRCRIARRHLCDECSTRRVVENGEEHRISDGQFLLVEADFVRIREQKKEAAAREFSQRVKQHNAAVSSLDRLEADNEANRSSLFGNVMDNVAKAVFGEEEQPGSMSQSESIRGLSDQLNQTRDQLNQRGEKLNTLAEKSERLANASKDFASMAKELNRQSQGGFFW